MADLKSFIRQRALDIGFDLVGFAAAGESTHRIHLEDWLTKKHHGEMTWMENHHEKRVNPVKLVPGTKTVVCLAVNYANLNAHPQIADYALGDDYHLILKKKMKRLYHELKSEIPELEARWFTDSAPVLERYWAQQAGLGWIGKNTMLISRTHGSYLFLAEMMINLDIEADPPHDDFCGTCRRCLDGCPTNAFDGPHQLDARRCISYLTIEKRSDLTEPETKMIGTHVFGCDVCQQVCPWNRFATLTRHPEFKARPELLELDANAIADLTDVEYQQIFKRSAIRRSTRGGLLRNAHAVQQNGAS